MAIRVVQIQNVSIQAIDILHEAGDAVNRAGGVPYQSSGMLKVLPSTKIIIEEARIDQGQLSNLESQNLIRVTRSVI